MPGETPQVTNTIARSLDEGWHYRPDWRRAVVEAYLIENQLQEPPLETLKDEEDCYIRQFYLFRRCGRCFELPSFKWAYACVVNNPTTGASSLVKSLTVARVPVTEIAEKLRTTRKNIAVFQKLYFDVGRYLDEEAWLASVIFAPSPTPQDPFEFRERYWLTAAFLRGERGLGQAFSAKVPISPEEREELTSEIKSIATARSFEFILALRTGLVPASHHDFDRLVKLLDIGSRQSAPEDDGNKAAAFVNALWGVMQKKAALPENANDLELQRLVREASDSTDEKTPQKKVLTW